MSDNTVFTQNDQHTVSQNQLDAPSVSPQPSQPESFQKPQDVKNLETMRIFAPDAGSDESSDSSSPFSFLPKLLKITGVLFVIAIIIFLFMQFVLPRLGSSNNKKVTLNYWGLWEDPQTMKSIIGDFQRKNPNITIVYTKQDIKQYRERVATRIQNGTGPDIFRFHNSWLPETSQYLLPLSKDVIDPKAVDKTFYPVIKQDLVKNGALYGVPLEIDVLALFFNKEIFAASGANPPTTWDEFARISRTLTVKNEEGRIKTAGSAMGTYDNIAHAPDILSLLFVQNGANIKNLASTKQSATDALNFYTSFAMGDSNVWDSSLDQSLLAFAKGDVAMYFGYSWDIFAIKALSPDLSFGIVPVPRLPGRSQTIASYWAEGISAKSTHQKEALTFMQFLAQKETAQKLFSEQSKTRLFGEPPARRDLAGSAKNNEFLSAFIAQAPSAVSSFFVADTFDNGLNEKANNYLGNAVRSMLNNTSSETALEALSAGTAQVLSQYGQ